MVSAQAHAEETASFLKIGVDARALGMGGAYTSLATGANALNWNPAGLANLGLQGQGPGGMRGRDLTLTHIELGSDTRFDYAGYAHALKYGVIGGGGSFLTQGAITGRDDTGRATGSYSAVDSAFTMGYAAKLPSDLRVGGAFKVLSSRLADTSATGFAVDLGAQKELSGVRGPGVPLFGIAVQNVGPGMKFLNETGQLPLTLAAGVGYRLPVGMTLAADFKERPYSRETEFDFGTEYAVMSSFAVRAGYGSLGGQNATGRVTGVSAMSGFAGGFGLKLKGYSLDYALTPFGQLGTAQRFTFGARF
ncbi:MAG: PorV/PorQ family protein [Elusimicrobia bacterium]|nr:PorV/PorQ family protein [Elusimicrobiota bacterium]